MGPAAPLPDQQGRNQASQKPSLLQIISKAIEKPPSSKAAWQQVILDAFYSLPSFSDIPTQAKLPPDLPAQSQEGLVSAAAEDSLAVNSSWLDILSLIVAHLQGDGMRLGHLAKALLLEGRVRL